MTDEPSSGLTAEEERKTRASNRRTILAFAIIVAAFAGPAVVRLARHLLDLL